MDELNRILKALANKRRLQILRYLKRGRSSVTDIAAEIKLSFKATSRHLSILAHANIVEKEQEGLVVWHSLASKKHPLLIEILKRV